VAADLAAAGTSADVVACDAASREALAGLLAWISAGGPRLAAVFHTAGGLDDGVLDGLDTPRLAGVLAAKAAGAAYLDELTADAGLEAFVLFSSAAGVLGAAGQGNYAAANAFLDALAEQRAARGQAATSVAWGPWAGAGLAQGAGVQRLRRGGLPAMDPDLAVRALGQAIDGGDRALAVLDVDWAQFATMATLAGTPLLRELPEVARGTDVAAGREGGGLAERLAGQPVAGQRRVLAGLVRAEAAAVLGHSSAEAVQPGRAFKDLGFDSLTALELRNRLAAVTGLKLPATLIYDYPTSVILADRLRAEISQDETAIVPPVFTELDQLESILSRIPTDSDMRTSVTARLQTILSQWMGAQDDANSNTVASRFQSATADEVLDFIDKEFGVL
jgi:acyl carrier protein